MPGRVLALLVLLTAPATAAAAEFDDQGPDLAKDPYHHNTALTTGRVAGFRELYGDPDALADALVPKTAAKGDAADLPIVNTRSAWAEVVVGDTKIGIIGPYGDAVVSNVKPGEYDISFTVSNGFTWTDTVQTRDPAEADPEP